jgi:hypothetical protein
VCAKSLKRLLRLSLYCNEAYNASLELDLLNLVHLPCLRSGQRRSTAVANAVKVHFSSKIVDGFSIQPFNVLPWEAIFRNPLTLKRIQLLGENYLRAVSR